MDPGPEPDPGSEKLDGFYKKEKTPRTRGLMSHLQTPVQGLFEAVAAAAVAVVAALAVAAAAVLLLQGQI